MSQPNTPFTPGANFAQSLDVGVSWEGIKFSVGDKEILTGLSGNALPRRSLAIMGSSGAGKTTFLNALSDRLAADGKHLKLEGRRFLNDVEYERKFRTMVGYVTQDDILDPMSTPEEALSFSLRIRRGTDHDETAAQVDHLLDELGLSEARNTVIGVPGLIAGLSGGERKRTNIGVELITNPKVLYLDEPTSGLDSVTSARICQLLKKLASRGRTVIYTIHQPTAECVQAFDDLMLMCKGHVVYHGPMDDAVEYFASIGYECPESYTPTDYFMTLLQDEQVGPILIDKWVERLKQLDPNEYAYTKPVQVTNDSMTANYLNEYSSAARSSSGIEFVELMKRSVSNVTRNKLLIGATIIQNLIFGLIVGIIFVNLKENVTGINDRVGLLFIVVTNLAFSSVMGMINNFPPRKAVYIRDQQSGAYSPLFFFLTLSLAELPLQIMATFLQCVVVYWISGLAPHGKEFFLYFAINLAVQQVGTGFGLAISTAIDSYIVASGAAPMIIIPFMLCAGLLASTDRLRPYWYWLEKPSFLRAGFVLLARNEFEAIDSFSCDPARYSPEFCARQPQNGVQVLQALKLNDDHGDIWIQWMVLGIIFVVTRIIVVAVLFKIAKTKN